MTKKTKKPTTIDMLKEFVEYTGKDFDEIKNLYEQKLIEENERNFNKWDDEILSKRVLIKLKRQYDENQFVLDSGKFRHAANRSSPLVFSPPPSVFGQAACSSGDKMVFK